MDELETPLMSYEEKSWGYWQLYRMSCCDSRAKTQNFADPLPCFLNSDFRDSSVKLIVLHCQLWLKCTKNSLVCVLMNFDCPIRFFMAGKVLASVHRPEHNWLEHLVWLCSQWQLLCLVAVALGCSWYTFLLTMESHPLFSQNDSVHLGCKCTVQVLFQQSTL
jgi:hypothetical protein